MAAPNTILPGFSASLWMQTSSTPTAFSTANLAVWTSQVATIVGTVANGTGAAGVALNVEAVPAFGQSRRGSLPFRGRVSRILENPPAGLRRPRPAHATCQRLRRACVAREGRQPIASRCPHRAGFCRKPRARPGWRRLGLSPETG